MEADQEIKKLQEIVSEKDNVIAVMEEQMNILMNEAKRLNLNLKDKDMSMSKDSKNAISLNINLKPSSKVESEHRRLLK